MIFWGCLTYTRFKASNIRDEPEINPCRDIRKKDESGKLSELDTRVECEVNSDRGDLLVRGFRDMNTDCIINIRIVNANQPYYLTGEPTSIIKFAENSKKLVFGALLRVEKALYYFCRFLRRITWKGRRCLFKKTIAKVTLRLRALSKLVLQSR